jgi:uncharacterized protein with von Willebrand factor type A (vWA) domain
MRARSSERAGLAIDKARARRSVERRSGGSTDPPDVRLTMQNQARHFGGSNIT